MESFLRDIGEARDACNKLPFDDALRDKIAAELDRIEAAPPLERMLVTKPPIKTLRALAAGLVVAVLGVGAAAVGGPLVVRARRGGEVLEARSLDQPLSLIHI